MARNTLKDLNNHLFEQLERLNDDEIQGEKLKEEVERARAMASIATKIIETGNLVLRAKKVMYEQGKEEVPTMLEG
ncbi:TPA: hypothetical protein ACF2C8_002864 [Clostridium perfringens]